MPSWRLQDVRGEEIRLEDPYFVYGASGIGIAAAEHLTTRLTYQDGERFEAALYDPREVQLGIDILADTAEQLPALRDALYRMLAPIGQGCRLRRVREDGSEREIVARLVGALDMPREARQSGCHQRVVLTLRCAQPHWYDPVVTLWVYDVSSALGTWRYPLGFPAGFGTSVVARDEVRTYPGQIDVYPEIRVTGPAAAFEIENVTLGTMLDLSAYTVAAGEVVTISLQGDQKTINSSDAGNILQYLSEDSDLGEWCIAAHPRAANGRNHVRVYVENATNATEVVIQFNTLFAGV